MTVIEIINATNDLIDDSLPSASILVWMNDSLMDLGVAVGANFPSMSLEDASAAPPIPDKWQELLKLYAASRAKEQDSSVVEADRFMVQYEAKKQDFITKYDVPDEYKDASDTSVYSATGTFPLCPYDWWVGF